MSSAHDAHGAPAHAHHDHDDFDGEPAHELSPGEPRTPGWLPALGLAFFSAVAVWLLVSGDASPAAPPPAPAAEPKPVAAAPAPAPVPTMPAAMRPRLAQPGVQPIGSGEPQPAGTGMRRLNPQQVEELKKRIEEARQKRAAEPGK